MTKHLKLFDVERVGETMIICPQGEGSAFRYRDLHQEANSVRGLLLQPGNKNLIIDMMRMDYCGSEFIGALISMLRETRTRGGKAMFCAAKPEMLQVLQNMSLFKLWPHFATREEALAAIQAA